METIIIIGGYEQIHCILLLLALLSELIFLFVLFLYFHLKKNLSGYIFFSCVIMAHYSSPSTPSNMDCQLLGQMFVR